MERGGLFAFEMKTLDSDVPNRAESEGDSKLTPARSKLLRWLPETVGISR